MPDFIDRVGAELVRAANADTPRPRTNAATDCTRPFNVAPGQAETVVPVHAIRRHRRRGARALGRAGVLMVALVGCSGVAVAAYVLLDGSQARKLPSFECQMNGSTTILPAVTGNPIVDCATAWPSASGGQENAPPLAIWGIDTNQQVSAIAQPLSLGSPGPNWRRLPDDWTVDLPIVELEDQLANIDLPFSDQGPSTACSTGSQDTATVRALLHDDGLDSWNVTVQAAGGGDVTNGCTAFNANVDSEKQTVELVQMPSSSATSAPATTQIGATTTTTQASPGMIAETAAVAKLKQLYADANARLSSSCESVTAATAIWTALASAAGFQPTSLAFEHTINTSQPAPATYPYHYTLYQQPASQNTGTCAHVLVMVVPGSGLANVYVARIAP
jgi:hypothetical protein